MNTDRFCWLMLYAALGALWLCFTSVYIERWTPAPIRAQVGKIANAFQLAEEQ